MAIENDHKTPQQEWAARERPLQFIRVRLYRGGQAEYIRDLLADEVDVLFEDLAKLRGEGKNENDPKLIETVEHIRHLNNALKDIGNGLIELVGGDGLG